MVFYQRGQRRGWRRGPYLSFCLELRWRSDPCRPEWPRPVCDAHLCLLLWLELCHWWGKVKASAASQESSVVSPTAGAHLEAEVKLLCALQRLKQWCWRVSKQPTCLSAGAQWRQLSVLGQSLLLQQLSDVHHLGWRHWFGSAVCNCSPNSISG